MKIIKESPDEVFGLDPEYQYYKKIAKFDNEDAFAFGIADGSMHISNVYGNSHSFLLPSKRMKELYIEKNTKFARLLFDYPGRVWLDKKIISFWIYPTTKQELKELVNQIEEQFMSKHHMNVNIWNDKDFKIEVNNEQDLPDSLEKDNYGQWTKFSEKTSGLIPIKEFSGSNDASAEDMKDDHLRGNKKWVPGYGSDKYSSEKPLAWRQALVAESLDESIKLKNNKK